MAIQCLARPPASYEMRASPAPIKARRCSARGRRSNAYRTRRRHEATCRRARPQYGGRAASGPDPATRSRPIAVKGMVATTARGMPAGVLGASTLLAVAEINFGSRPRLSRWRRPTSTTCTERPESAFMTGAWQGASWYWHSGSVVCRLSGVSTASCRPVFLTWLPPIPATWNAGRSSSARSRQLARSRWSILSASAPTFGPTLPRNSSPTAPRRRRRPASYRRCVRDYERLLVHDEAIVGS